MSIRRITGTLIAAIALTLVAVVPARAQDSAQVEPAPVPPQSAAQAVPDTVRQLIMELRQAQRELTAIRRKAFEQNPELRQRRQALQEEIRAAMIEINPEIEQTLQRMEELKKQFKKARKNRNMAKLQSLLGEARKLQRKVQKAQAKALRREAVSKDIQTFEDRVMVAMKKVDPQTQTLLERVNELMEKLRTVRSQS